MELAKRLVGDRPAGLTVDGLSWGPSRNNDIISDLSFDVRPGEMLAVVGPNGAGKSSLLRCLYRFLRPNTGVVRLDGEDIWAMQPRLLARRVATVLQEPASDFGLTVAEIVELGLTPHLDRFSAQDYGPVDDALALMGLTALSPRDFASLSGGEKQRVMIARALVQKPDLIILDEPTNHLDIRHQLEVLDLLAHLPTTVIVSLHDLALASAHASRVLVLEAGRQVRFGGPLEVLTPETIRQTFAVRAAIDSHPAIIRYYEPSGAVDLGAMQRVCKAYAYPNAVHNRGFLAFAAPDEIAEAFVEVGRFVVRAESSVLKFAEMGFTDPEIRPRDASNIVTSMLRQSWELFCRSKGMTSFNYSNQVGFHASEGQIPIGKKVPWGRQGQARSSMLRNVAKGKVWNFGSSAIVSLWPYPHIRLKARVLFSEYENDRAGSIIDDRDVQFRLRRTVCKSWRNKQWLGRLMAYLELLSGDSAYMSLPASPSLSIRVEAAPILFTSPVSTKLPDVLRDEDEEVDESTFGNRDIDEGPND